MVESEVIFLAERIDLLDSREEEVDLGALWAQGNLSGDPDRVAPQLADRDEAA